MNFLRGLEECLFLLVAMILGRTFCQEWEDLSYHLWLDELKILLQETPRSM